MSRGFMHGVRTDARTIMSRSGDQQHPTLLQKASGAVVSDLALPSWIDYSSVQEISNPFAKRKQLFLVRTSIGEKAFIMRFKAGTRRYENEKRCLLELDGRTAPR